MQQLYLTTTVVAEADLCRKPLCLFQKLVQNSSKIGLSPCNTKIHLGIARDMISSLGSCKSPMT